MLHAACSEAPATPAINKWTKLSPVVDFLLLGLLCHSIFYRAFQSLRLPQTQDVVDHSMDFDMIKDVFFSAVAGNRYTASLRFLADAATIPALVTLGLVLEPIRVLSSWFMRRAREVELYHSCRRPLMDILHAPTSVLTTCMQYLSSLLLEVPRRLILLWRPSGCADYSAWFSTCPDQVRQLRRLVLLTSASMYRRHYKTFHSFPWLFVSLVDGRVSGEEKQRIAAMFDASHECCLSAGFPRKLKQRVVTGQDL